MPGGDWKPWWVLFPMVGFAIREQRNDLKGTPLFGDATILSARHIGQVAHLLGYKQVAGGPGNMTRAEWIEIVRRLPNGEHAEAFLAVRCMADMTSNEHKARALTHARERAYQIASALCLLFLARSYFGRVSGLFEQVHKGMERY